MKLLVNSILTMAMLGFSAAQAQSLANSPGYESAAKKLRSATPRQYNFSKAVMGDVMRLMAEDAGISFFGLPDGGDDQMVTFTINASPFAALETLAKANKVALIYDQGIWYLRPANDTELIGRIYEVSYNPHEKVTSSGGGGGLGGGSAGGGGGAGGGGINLQGNSSSFQVEDSRLLEDIQNILGIATTGAIANIAPTTSVDSLGQLSLRTFQTTPGVAATPAAGSTQTGAPAVGGAGAAPDAKVIWNSDSNTLYVVATRQQHQWVEAYLKSADRELDMIAIEVKFLEMGRSPKTDLGINWTGVLNSRGQNTTLNLASNTGLAGLPTAVLNYRNLSASLEAAYSDGRTKSISYPRMLTMDNREVSFRSVINQPVLASSASASLGTGATETSDVEYIPIGTVINVLPKKMKADKILLNVAVTVSDIVRTETINGNPFPVASSRVYNAPLTVQNGYTVAISGLDAASDERNEKGIPVLGKLPAIGAAFRTEAHKRDRQHLMMLITPKIVKSCGVSSTPMTQETWCTPCGGPQPARSGTYNTPHMPMIDIEEKEFSGKHGGWTGGAPNSSKRYSAPGTRKSKLSFGKKSSRVQASNQQAADWSRLGNKQYQASSFTHPTTNNNSTYASPKLASINRNVAELRSDLNASGGDRRKIAKVMKESKTLLSKVESMRGGDSTSLTGELGDTWWSIIKLQTDANAMSR